MACIHSFVVVLCYFATLSGWTEAQTFATTVSFVGAVSENEGGFQACVERSGNITDPVTVTLTSEEVANSAIAPDDYDTVNESLEFTQTSNTIQCINVTIHEDTIIEMVEFFELQTTSLNTGVTINNPSHFIILQDTSQIQVGFTQPILSLTEASGSIEIGVCAVILVGSVEKNVEIVFDFTDGTASSTTDYTAVSSTGRFTPNRNTVCKIATISDDEFIEEDEFFTVSVFGTSINEVNATGRLQVIIIDTDGVTLSVDNATVIIVEGNTDNTSLSICITLDDIMGGLERNVEVTAVTNSSTAGNADFEPVTTTFAFPFSSSVNDRMCIQVNIIGDEVYEPDETFTVHFSPVNPDDVISGPDMSTITIINNDSRTTLSIDNTTVAVVEGDADNTSLSICITLDDIMGPFDRDVEVTAVTMSSSAGDGDFVPLSTSLTFPSSSSVTDTMCIEVTVIGDEVFEQDETFTVLFSTVNPDNLISGLTMSTVTILNEDARATLSIANTTVAVVEGDADNTSLSICITLDDIIEPFDGDIEVTAVTVSSTADAEDFKALSITFPFTSSVTDTLRIEVTVIGDEVFESNETFSVLFSTVNPNDVISGPNMSIITILNDDTSATLSITNTTVTIVEGTTDNTSFSICITLEDIMGPFDRDVEVTAVTVSSSADAKDFKALSVTISFTFTSSVTDTMCIEVTVIGDEVFESDETFSVLFSTVNPNDVISVPSMSNVTMLNDDTRATLSIDNTTVTIVEGDTDNTSLSICITLEDIMGPFDRDVEVTAVTVSSSADVGDFEPLLTTLNFPSNSSVPDTVCVAISVIGDAKYEPDETFTVMFSPVNPNDVISGSSISTVRILNDDSRAILSIDNTTVAIVEGNNTDTTNISVCISLDDILGPLDRDIEVSVSTVESTADDGDFKPLSTTLIFQSTSSVNDTMCIEVTVIDDEVFEPDETITVLFSTVNPNDAIYGPSMSIITILNDDAVDCGLLDPPLNGNVLFTSTTVGSVAVYTCLPNFDLLPLTDPAIDIDQFVRTCESDGKWSEEEPVCKGPTGGSTSRTVGIAVGVVAGVAVAVVIIVIIIGCLVVRRQRHYNKYVLPYKDHVRPYSVYANEGRQQPTHDENPYAVDPVIGEEIQREPAADEPESPEYETEAHVQSEEVEQVTSEDHGEQVTSEDQGEYAKKDLEEEDGDPGESATIDFYD